MCIRYCRDDGNPFIAARLRQEFDATGDLATLLAALELSDLTADGTIEYFFLDHMEGLPPSAEAAIKSLGYEEFMANG